MLDILSGITALVKTTNIEVIAEGVETASQVEILKKAGVKMA
ncbi:MAG: EAL domain-containing protein [Gammaproteobacteria bacterium]